MVHAIRILKCQKGHILPITYDENNCGCHHDGKPCIMINCTECTKLILKGEDAPNEITIPVNKEDIENILTDVKK